LIFKKTDKVLCDCSDFSENEIGLGFNLCWQ